MPRVKTTGRMAVAAALGAAGVAGWEIQRRRDARAVERDPVWSELRRPLRGKTRRVLARDGTWLHAEVFGEDHAPAVVLVHGWTCSLEFWQYQIRDLANDYRVIAYDQRGHGRSAVPRDPEGYTAQSLAGDLEAVLGACLNPEERFVVAGHSMGGMTIVAWAGEHPNAVASRVAGVALVNTALSDLVERLLFFGALGARALARIAPALERAVGVLPSGLTPLSFRALRRAVLGRRATPGQVAFVHRMLVDCPAPVRTGFARLFPTLDLSGSVQHLTAPAVVITGEQDRLLPPWHGEQLAARLPSLVEYVELPDVGHMTPIEAPEAINERLRRLAEQHLVTAAPGKRAPASV